jgi:predicted GNAT family acetyltransferase
MEVFAEAAEAFLAQGLERNVLATVFMNIRAGAYATERVTFAFGSDERGATTAVALRVAPWPMLVTGIADPADALVLAEQWLATDPDVAAVNAEPLVARAVAGAIAKLTGRRDRLRVSEAMHVLDAVAPPARPSSGACRPAEQHDREVLVEWERAFTRETGFGSVAHADQSVARRLAARSQFVWQNEDPVATAGLHPPVAGTARVGPVYTPPEHRRNGYATALVAELSSHAMRAGAARCMLFTDLANPTSNKIYARIGYRRCGDWEERVLET